MGIHVEFNPDLALRSMQEFRDGKRSLEECIPEPLEEGRNYPFLKSGQRNYWLEGEIPLVQTDGNQQLSRPLASIIILDATHFIRDSKVWTRGTYHVVEVYKPSDTSVHFDGFTKLQE
jgi:hypothetical protein